MRRLLSAAIATVLVIIASIAFVSLLIGGIVVVGSLLGPVGQGIIVLIFVFLLMFSMMYAIIE